MAAGATSTVRRSAQSALSFFPAAREYERSTARRGIRPSQRGLVCQSAPMAPVLAAVHFATTSPTSGKAVRRQASKPLLACMRASLNRGLPHMSDACNALKFLKKLSVRTDKRLTRTDRWGSVSLKSALELCARARSKFRYSRMPRSRDRLRARSQCSSDSCPVQGARQTDRLS